MNAYRWSELHPGLTHSFAVEVTPAMMQNFLALSDDTNPLHLDREFATESGFREVVAYGMLTSALYSRLVGVYPAGPLLPVTWNSGGFFKSGYVGDQLTVRGEIAYLNEAFRRIEIKASIQTDSQVISKAKIKVGLNEH